MYVFDIDGTLADPSHRLAHLPAHLNVHCLKGATEEEIQRFMHPDLVAKDAPIEVAFNRLITLYTSGVAIGLITARREELRVVTEAWLKSHVGTASFFMPILMRPNNDHRPSLEVKLDIAGDLSQISVWYDDDIDLVAALINKGVDARLAPVCFEVE